MLPRIAFLVLVVLLIGTTAMHSQQRITMSGQYATVRMTTDTIGTPDGGAVVHFTYGLVSSGEDPGGLFTEGKGNCVGTTVLAEDGNPVAGGGSCFVTDMEGDGWWQWWKLEAVGTADCPIMCGTWGSYHGTGKFEGVSVSGTFNGVAAFADGSGRGLVEGTYERP
jgi:hypothetical protein